MVPGLEGCIPPKSTGSCWTTETARAHSPRVKLLAGCPFSRTSPDCGA